MTEVDAAALIVRIEKLERRLRRLRRLIGGTMLAGVIAVAAMLSFGGHVLADTEASGVIKARGFEVVNPSGEVLAKLGSWTDSSLAGGRSPSLAFYNSDGSPNISIGDLRTNITGPWPVPAMILRGEAKSRMVLASTEDFPSLRLYDRAGGLRVRLMLADTPPNAIPGVLSRAEASKGYAPAGTPSLQFVGRESYIDFADAPFENMEGVYFGALDLGLTARGTGGILLYDENDRSADISPRLAIGSTTFSDKSGDTIITPESSITAFATNGNVVAHWPSP